MKKTLQSIGVAAALTFGAQANAQLPDYGIYPGGLVLDQFGPGGPTWDIDSILDAGTPVIIDMFAVWCGPCWSYHTGGTLETVYDNIGTGGTGEVFIVAVEADTDEPEADMDGGGSSVGDWISGTPYPMVNNDDIAGMMNLAYYPTLILICPDRTVTEVGQVSASAWETAVSNCGTIATDANDLRIVSNETPTTAVSCGGASVNQMYEVVIQNYSTANVTGTKTVSIMDGVTPVATANVPVNLDPYEAMLVTLGPVTLAVGANAYNAAITTADDELTNNAIATPVTVSNAADVGTGDLVLHIKMDNYAQEVGVLMASGLPYQSTASAAYSAGNGGTYTGLVDFQAIGTWPGNGSGSGTIRHVDWYDLAPGCYHFIMFDNYGDGILSPGTITLESESGYNGTFPTNYTNWATYSFEVTAAGDGGFTGIEEVSTVTSATVYPNPATDLTNIEFNVTEVSDVTVQVINTLGQVVYTNNMGEVNGTQKVVVNTADLEAGMYLINITVNGNVMTKRVSVAK